MPDSIVYGCGESKVVGIRKKDGEDIVRHDGDACEQCTSMEAGSNAPGRRCWGIMGVQEWKWSKFAESTLDMRFREGRTLRAGA